MNNVQLNTEEIAEQKTEDPKPGRDYEFFEDTIDDLNADLKPGDMLIFRNDMSDKAWETFKSFMAESPGFVSNHKMDLPGGPSWNEFAKFFLREFAWAAENILNSKQLRIKNLKNRLKKKIVNVPFECVHARQIKN